MEVLDRILGFFEVLAVPATLFWLLRGDLSTRKLLAAIVVAVTVAQPFGIVATPVYNPPDHAKFASPTGVHVLHVLGIPVMPYVVYRRRNIDPATAIGDNGPSMTLRVRSWFWLPVLTNSTEVAAICSTDNSVPCWDPTAGPPGERDMRVLENGDGASIVIGSQGHGFYSFIWKLDVGIASPAGAAYWLAVIAIVLAKRRVARTRKPNVMAGDAPSTDDASDPADHGAHP